MGRGSFGGLLASAWLLACAETRVTLLKPNVDANGGSASIAPAAGGNGGAIASSDGGASASANLEHLVHRYDFEGEGTRVVDSIASADGTLLGGAVLDGAGHATLDGTDDYVNLPNGLLSGLTDVSIVAWLSWNGDRPCWQRVFDFGSSDAGEDNVGNATSSLFATPERCPGTGPAAAFETREGIVSSVDSDAPFPVLRVSMLAVVVDSKAASLRLYAAGEPLGTGKGVSLAQLRGDNDWLGRSQWMQDPYLRGTYDEFRIYDIALSSADLSLLEAAGPDALVR